MSQPLKDTNPYTNLQKVFYDYFGPNGGFVLLWQYGTYPTVAPRKLQLEAYLGARMEHVRR